jgi:potassium efflux system protein
MELIHDLHMEIHRRFAAEKINIAFPQLDVHFYRGDDKKIPESR